MSKDRQLASESAAQNYEELLRISAELERKNSQLQLLLNLTNRITSNLELHELLCAVSANIREVMHCEGVAIYLADSASESFTVHALDLPHGKGLFKEGLRLSPPK